MSGISIGHSHPRPCMGGKTLRRCRNNEEADSVVLIDVDTGNFENVIIIDVPESLPKKTQHSSMHRKDKKWSFRNVIYIDDEENHDSSHSFGVNTAGTSSYRESCRVAKNLPESAYTASEDRQYAQDTAIPVRLSKCKRTYSGKASPRNCFGLNTDSESDSSDSDSPDCELVEDSSGKVQEMWEKAFSRRKRDFRNSHSDIRYHDSASRVVDGDRHHNFEMDDVARQHKEASLGFSTGKFNNENDNPSCFRTKEDSSRQLYKEFDHPTPVFEDDDTSDVGPSPPKFKSCVDVDPCYGKSSPLEDEATIYRSKNSFETEANTSRYSPGDKYQNTPVTATSNDQESEHLESVHPHATEGAEPKLREDISISNIQQEEDKDGQLHSEDGETLPSVETSIINEREKLKETDEYKRAMEAEWASRQQALQIQAEEAKRLRQLEKRKKAESRRLLDMERRQKQRIEEVRNIQKKDEENMNLKERMRAVVIQELNKLEVSCHSMGSLLHSLGIHVKGWPNPLPQEVQSAYKRALLAFHPDRASQSDIRQQVEAEEKFKLINRLKEKFSPSL